MTLKSTRYAIWSRLTTRFLLEPTQPPAGGRPELTTTVVPVTSVDELLQVPTIPAQVANDISAGAGTFTAYFTVPADKRWRLVSYFRDATTANTRIRINSGAGSVTIPITDAGTASQATVLATPLLLDQTFQIGLDTTGDAGDNNIGMNIYYLEEDAFS